MSKFYNLEGQSVVVEAALDDLRPVEEGWGAALAKYLGLGAVGVAVTSIVNKINVKVLTDSAASGDFESVWKKMMAIGGVGVIASLFGQYKANKLINMEASKKLVELLNKDEIKKHIVAEAEKAFKEAKKEHKHLTVDVEKVIEDKANSKEASADDRGIIKRFLTYYAKCTTKVDKYTVFATGDFKSIDSLFVIFFDEEENKVVRKALPVPTVSNEEKPAEESMEIAEEGWGTAILKAFGVYGSGMGCIALGAMFGATVPGLIAGMFAGFKAMKAIDMAANKDLKKLLERADIKSFIEKEADKAFKEAKKENKNLVLEVEEALKNVQHMDEAEEDARSWITKYFTKLARCFLTVGKYTVIATGDLDSVDTLYLLMFDKAANKVVKKAIPLPVIKKEAE